MGNNYSRKRRRLGQHVDVRAGRALSQPEPLLVDETLPDGAPWNSLAPFPSNVTQLPWLPNAPLVQADFVLARPSGQDEEGALYDVHGAVWRPDLSMPLSSPTHSLPDNLEWTAHTFPGFFPVLPDKESRQVTTSLTNPFSDNATEHLPSHRSVPAVVRPQNGVVNGYIKFSLGRAGFHQGHNVQSRRSVVAEAFRQRAAPEPAPPRRTSESAASAPGRIMPSPPGFGMNCSLDPLDHNLFSFYRSAFCRGRTILPRTNCWQVDIAPMLTSSESLRYTLLSLAATYVLDYFPNEDIRTRANAYYQRAVALLSDALSQPEEQMIGGGDSLVGTIVVFIMHDTVTWEHRRPKSQVPRWLEGARLASRILDATDPGYRYWHSPENVQSTTAYTSNTVLVARAAILGLLMTPLDPIHTKGQFGWLLHGIERNARKVHGGCGFSPKLLHIFAQITQLASQMALEPSSVILPKGAEYIKSKLANLRQWSELSPETDGYASTEALLDSCVLNEHGVIECPKKMTDLGAEAWRIAAQIYLQCRFFRLPRSHAEVMTNCRRLSECVRRMPCYGPLFTAQAPLFPVFLLGLVSVSEEDFGIARNWFETVLSATSCRSSVPPVWDALKILRIWVDGEITDEPHIDMIPVGQRQPWWEDIVAHATETVGTLCLM